MTPLGELRRLLRRYLQLFPAEERELRAIAGFLEGVRDEAEAISRKTPGGHLTASAVVVSRDRRRALLVRHVTLGRYLQPGGHVETDDATVLDAALREVREETPATELTGVQVDADPLVPLDIDSHLIPPNPAKDEGAHLHHDLRYLFVAETELVPDSSGEWEWRELERLERDGGELSRLAGKARRLLLSRPT